MFALATKCQGLAETTNTNNATIQQIIPALRAGEKCLEHLIKQVEGIKEQFLEQSVRTIETSYNALETNCVAMINKMADHQK